MRPATVTTLVVGSFLGLLLVTTAFGSWYTIDQQERGVILRNGAVAGTAEPGLHFKMPWIDSVSHIATRTHTLQYQKVETYSRDQQPVDIALSVTYHIPAGGVAEVYTVYGSEQRIIEVLITPRVYEQLKNVFGTYDAVTAIQERSRLNADVGKAVAAGIKGPVIVDSIQLQDIKFSRQYEASIEQRMQAQVEVQKLEQNLQREKVQAQIVVTQATAQADAVRATATANAFAVRASGEATAAAIKARGDALRDNPNLVTLTAAERWNGALPTTMVPGSAVPFIGVK